MTNPKVIINLLPLLLATCCALQSLGPQQALAFNPTIESDNEPASNYNRNPPKLSILPNKSEFSIPITEANTKSLTCRPEHAQPSLFSNIQWNGPNSFDNHEELKKRHKVVPINGNALKLFFTNPTADDSGTYYCTGDHNGEPYNSSIRVKFEIPMKLDPCPRIQHVIKGDTNAKITCHVTGETPVVLIYKDNIQINSSQSRYKVNSNEGLTIVGPVDESDGGVYLFTADSAPTGEYREEAIQVDVSTPPEIEPFRGTAPEFTGIEGERATLSCKTLGKPKPFVLWYNPKHRNLTDLGNYHVNREEGTLIIDRVNKEEDLGNFKCVAYNSVGQTERTVSMTVFTKPIITKFENMTADENSTVILECRATGIPKPEITIRKAGLNQKPFTMGDGFVQEIDERVEEAGLNVHIYRVKIVATRETRGILYCSAKNAATGNLPIEKIGHLHTNIKPDLSQTPKTAIFKRGQRGELICHVQAYPTPTITWYDRNTQIRNAEVFPIVGTDGITYISKLFMPDTGNEGIIYVCKAENSMGYSTKEITTIYATPPGIVQVLNLGATATTIDLELSAFDGYNRITNYTYTLFGNNIDWNVPLRRNYPVFTRNDTIISNPQLSNRHRIKDLWPRYSYALNIRAVNEIGSGPSTQHTFETSVPTPPSAPIIVLPTTEKLGVYTSEYQNGYLLKWNPPEYDNGSPIIKYIIKTNRLENSGLTTQVQEKLVEQMSERPLHVRLGPLEINRRYKIEISAVNAFGTSPSNYIMVETSPDRPLMPEYEPSALSWIIEPSTPTIIAILTSVIVILIIVDLIFHFCHQIGATYTLRNWCCPSKASSVISETTYT